jgi:hypothetical protein
MKVKGFDAFEIITYDFFCRIPEKESYSFRTEGYTASCLTDVRRYQCCSNSSFQEELYD